jgi:hypothetical protein
MSTDKSIVWIEFVRFQWPRRIGKIRGRNCTSNPTTTEHRDPFQRFSEDGEPENEKREVYFQKNAAFATASSGDQTEDN